MVRDTQPSPPTWEHLFDKTVLVYEELAPLVRSETSKSFGTLGIDCQARLVSAR